MINLLSPEAKKEIRQEEKLKMAFIFGSASFLFLISLIIILLSLKIYLGGEISLQKSFLEERKKEIDSPLLKDFYEKAGLFNLNLGKLKLFYQEQVSFIRLFEKIAKIFPPGSHLTGLILNPEGKEKTYQSKITISGFCPNREDLLVLKQNLEREKDIKEIDFPSSNWIEPVNINFTLSFKMP